MVGGDLRLMLSLMEEDQGLMEDDLGLVKDDLGFPDELTQHVY